MVGVNQHRMSDTNKYIVLKTLATKGAASRTDLCEISGLSKMAITAIVNEYIEKGVLRECGQLDSNGGRKAKLLEIQRDKLLTLAVCIDREQLDVGIVTMRGEILANERMPFSAITSNEVLMKSIFYLCDLMWKKPISRNIWGIGVSCVGPLSIANGAILNPPDFHFIHDVKIVEALEQRYQCTCYLQNDMCMAALAEAYYGNKNNYRNFLYLGISTGVGGGVILNSKLFTGANGLAGVVGHTIVEKDGLPCACGQRGCLEQYSSVAAIVAWARRESKNPELSWMQLVQGLTEEDALSVRAFDRMAEYLSVAISNFQSAFDMECVIVGGELYGAKPYLVKLLRQKAQNVELAWAFRRSIAIEPSFFESNAQMPGAAALVLENNLDNH